MSLYELSIDAPLVREAEKVVSLEGRGFPSLVMRWDSRLFDQPWQTTVVLDYLISLPPLMVGQASFNEVRIAAFVGGASTKFMYFGTEMSANVPRVAPEMENQFSPQGEYQEFRLEEQTCPLPYLKLIQATPRIYGPGPQDYYSPAIKVERFDAAIGPEQLADFFPQVVANLEVVKGSVLIDPSRGLWNGSRYVGVTSIAIVRQGKVVGLHKRVGRVDKDPLPPEIKRRDPKLDVLKAVCAIDVGACTTVVALRSERSQPEIVRVGPASNVSVPADYESPTELSFTNLARTVKAWRDRVILPLTRWEDATVGATAKSARLRPGADQGQRAAATVSMLPLLRERIERADAARAAGAEVPQFRLRGAEDPDTAELLRKPAPPIIDEDGIGAHDPFDPLELYAYQIGLTVNQRSRGIVLRYSVAMPTGWSPERRKSVLIAFRRGIYRSLPAGLVDYHDTETLEVLDAGPATIPLTVQALRIFNIQPKLEAQSIVTIDAGASETGILFSILRNAKPDERENGLDKVIEHLEPTAIPWLGAERLLHRLAYRVFLANQLLLGAMRVRFEKPDEEDHLPDDASLIAPSPEGRANVGFLKDALRPFFEGSTVKVPPTVRVVTEQGDTKDVAVEIDREDLTRNIDGWFEAASHAFHGALDGALQKIGREPDRFDGLRVIVGGRMGMNQRFADHFLKPLPQSVLVHRFREPDKSNISAPTVKTATALGVLAMRFDRVGPKLRAEKRDAFRYRVGRARHGQLADVLDPSVDYDAWREMGACLKPEVEILFMMADDDGDVAADDPRVSRATCALGPRAVGHRLYLRAVGAARVEISVGPPGGEPDKGAPHWAIDLHSAEASAV
jgi:hypothetical protein